MLGDDAKFNANKMIDIFKGEDNDFSKAVCLNAAAGLLFQKNITILLMLIMNARDTYFIRKNLYNI